VSQIQVDHKGYVITYAENEDVWRCWALDGIEAKTLSAMRGKIDKIDADGRRVSNIRAWRLPSTADYGGPEPVVIVMLVEDDEKPRYGEPPGPRAWVLHVDRTTWEISKGRAKSREKVALLSLAAHSPEAQAAIDLWLAAVDDLRAAKAKADAALKAVPRMTLEQVSPAKSET
jgi:hypothetical protein